VLNILCCGLSAAMLLPVFGIMIFAVKAMGKSSGRRGRTVRRGPLERKPLIDLEGVVEADPNFSLPALLDFSSALFVRVHEAQPGALDTVDPWLSSSARTALAKQSHGLKSVDEVIIGGIRLRSARRDGGWLKLSLEFVSNRTETPIDGPPVQVYVEEAWTLRKAVDELSPSPERMAALSCPSCGNPAETDPSGRCTHCSTVVGDGRWMWEIELILQPVHEPVGPPELGPVGPVEEGTELKTVFDPDRAAGLRALQGRDSGFQLEAFQARVEELFLAIQRAWSDGEWERARPWVSNHLYQTQRFWQLSNRRAGLRNRLEQVEVRKVEVVKIITDAWYESITVRVHAAMADWMEDSSGQVVQGDRDQVTRFSEYWVFIRALGREGGVEHDPLTQCPSCGAPLDQVGETGVCGYCDSVITGGSYDWILSRIEQDEAYR